MSPAAVVFSAVPTLFGSDGEVDIGANRALYKFVAGLLDGLFVAGTTGEFPALDDAERLSLIELALAEAGPDRVIAHIGAPDARHSARLAGAAAALGATRLAAITPYYLPARPDELTAHYGRIRDAAPDAELYAYIFPERTGLRVSPALFAAAGVGGGPGGRQAQRLGGGRPGRVRGGGSGPADLLRRRLQPGGHDAGRRSRAGLRPQQRVPRGLRGADRRLARRRPGRGGRGTSGCWTGSSPSGRASAGSSTRWQLRGLGGTTARMTVDPPDASLAAAIAAEVAALLSRFTSGCEPRVRVARHLFRGPAKAGRRTSN